MSLARPALAALVALAALSPGRAPAALPADAYVLVRGESSTSTNLSLEAMERLRARLKGDFLWARRGGKERVFREGPVLSEAVRLFERFRELDPEREVVERAQRAAQREEALLDREMDRLEESAEEAAADVDRDADAEEADEAVGAEREAAEAALESRRGELEARMRAAEGRAREADRLEEELDRKEEALEQEIEADLWRLVDRS